MSVDVDLPFVRPLPSVEMASEQHTPQRSPALGAALAYQLHEKQTQNLLEYRCMRQEILGENSDVAASSPAGVTANSGTDDTAHTATDVDSVRNAHGRPVSSTQPGTNFPPPALDWAPTPVNMKKWYRRDNTTGKLLVYEGTHPDQQSKGIPASLSPSSPAMHLCSLDSIAGIENTFPPKPYHSPPLGTGEFIDDQCWACELCTYVNRDGSAVACEICLNPRDMPKCNITPPGSKPRRVLSLNVVSSLRRSRKSQPPISVENKNRENDPNAGNIMYGKSNEGYLRQTLDKKKSKRPGASSSSSSILLFQRLRRRNRISPEKALYEIPQRKPQLERRSR